MPHADFDENHQWIADSAEAVVTGEQIEAGWDILVHTAKQVDDVAAFLNFFETIRLDLDVDGLTAIAVARRVLAVHSTTSDDILLNEAFCSNWPAKVNEICEIAAKAPLQYDRTGRSLRDTFDPEIFRAALGRRH